MSISDNSGPISTRGTTANRDDSARGDNGSARYQAADTGSGKAVDHGASDPGAGKPLPPDGSGPEGDPRGCAYVITYEEWHTASDERVCPECAPLSGQWYEQGSGPQPPLHDHCRCYRFVVWWDCYQSDGTWEKGGRPF